MPRKISVVTNNSYFFVGIAAQLCAEDREISQMSSDELSKLSVDNFNQRDALIFHTPNYINEMTWLVTVLTFPGNIILVPARARVRFNLDFERRRVVDVHDDAAAGYHEPPGKTVFIAQFIQYKLTRREKAILLHTINGKTPQDIGQLLAITTKTVYTHRRNALRKLGGRNLFQVCPIKDAILTSAIC
ncbi:MAG: helix-turn-helix transcriptional regulator [Enterobacterales bacterium]|uniref:helix-turn-helix transcriptional regulator n=1 Tax=Serratia sp. (in: enterobacteria) TaxID=616 RepID=UPI003F373515